MRAGPFHLWFLCLAVVLAATAPLVAGAGQDVAVDSVAYAGDGAVATPRDQTYLWRSGPHAFEVVVAAGDGSGGDYDVCLESQPPDAERPTRLACQAATVEAGGQTAVTVPFDRWPTNLTGQQEVTAVVTPTNETGGGVAASGTTNVTVLVTDADPDGDGLTNGAEASAGTGFFVADTDGDGLADGLEIDTYGTEPTERDTDGDGLTDGAEVNEYQTNPLRADTDGDGLTDDLEVDPHATNPNKADTDGDGLRDAAEVNTYSTDPTRADTDDDGLGDAAEVNTYGTNPNQADTDEDGLADGPEANVHGTDPAKADTDGDGLDDAAEVNDYQTDPTVVDTDGDGLDDAEEVNVYDTNPNAADTDGDGRADGEEVEAGTDPLTPDAGVAARPWPVPVEVVVGLLLVGTVLVGLYVLLRRPTGVVERVRRLGVPRTDGDAADAASTEPATPPPPIPTNQNRVLELLRDNGGRMLQSDIVEATDWSKSKVSRVLSDMDEEGEVAKIDVGKGNLIALPEVAPPNARSALDRGDE